MLHNFMRHYILVTFPGVGLSCHPAVIQKAYVFGSMGSNCDIIRPMSIANTARDSPDSEQYNRE